MFSFEDVFSCSQLDNTKKHAHITQEQKTATRKKSQRRKESTTRFFAATTTTMKVPELLQVTEGAWSFV